MKLFKSCGVIAIIIVVLIATASDNASAAKRGSKQAVSPAVVTHIPVEVIDSLKANDLSGAIRNIRMEATTPRSQYILTQMQSVESLEKGSKGVSGKDYRQLFNVGVAYHNLFLFLNGYGINNEYFFKQAVKYYKKAYKSSSPSRKSITALTMAALYAANNDIKKAQNLYKKTDIELITDQFRKYETLALYYSAMNDVDNTIINLELAHNLKPDYTKFWLGISDDFIQVSNNEEFKKLLNKWKVVQPIRGS